MEDKLKELMKDELFARGYEIRRQAFGDAVVDADAAVRMNDEFQRPMWQHGVQAAWGLLWSRPGLDARARSIATLSALVALNVPDEIEKHVRAAVSNGRDRSRAAGALAASVHLLRLSQSRLGVQNRQRRDEGTEDEKESGRKRQGGKKIMLSAPQLRVS